MLAHTKIVAEEDLRPEHLVARLLADLAPEAREPVALGDLRPEHLHVGTAANLAPEGE